jgi:hypothetical protein
MPAKKNRHVFANQLIYLNCQYNLSAAFSGDKMVRSCTLNFTPSDLIGEHDRHP